MFHSSRFVRAHAAAEPKETFLRLAVAVDAQELAFETCVLGRVRSGYRVFRLRSALGTRIELCLLFVKITLGTEANRFNRGRWSYGSEAEESRLMGRRSRQTMHRESSWRMDSRVSTSGRQSCPQPSRRGSVSCPQPPDTTGHARASLEQ